MSTEAGGKCKVCHKKLKKKPQIVKGYVGSNYGKLHSEFNVITNRIIRVHFSINTSKQKLCKSSKKLQELSVEVAEENTDYTR